MINLSKNKFNQELKGRRIIRIERRAKALVFKLDKGLNLLIHLPA